jgi:hypothetical protein
MKWCEALELMKQGVRVRMPEWSGYWAYEDGAIIMHCKDGEAIDIRNSEDILYTLGFTIRDDWELADETNSKLLQGEVVCTFGIGEMRRRLRLGKKVARIGWNGKGMYIIYVPQSISMGEDRGAKYIRYINPHFLIKNVDDTFSTWVPSVSDFDADDWIEVE